MNIFSYVIYEADKINLNAANACLKLLEDEKKDKFGILLSKNLQNMPKTLVVLLTLFLARWGHALLDNPGGFGEEFRALALPRWFAHATGVVAIVLMVSSGGVKEAAAEIAMLMLLLLMVHGLAIAHGIVKLLEAARGWLVLLYLVLLVTPLSSFLVLALAMAGLSDSWVGYRQRVHNRIT